MVGHILPKPIFGVRDNVLKMHLKVEYYQWEEHSHEERDKLGGGEEAITICTYKNTWVSKRGSASRWNLALSTIRSTSIATSC